jgi:hypothetical protein
MCAENRTLDNRSDKGPETQIDGITATVRKMIEAANNLTRAACGGKLSGGRPRSNTFGRHLLTPFRAQAHIVLRSSVRRWPWRPTYEPSRLESAAGTSRPKAQNLRSVLMQSGHLWTSGPAEPVVNDPKRTQRLCATLVLRGVSVAGP